MKKLLLSITALVLTVAVFAQKKSADVAKFTSETIDLGKILQDHPTTASFEVTNISKEPLLIEQASPTCGCTISDYTKEPIAPGKSGFIKATYNEVDDEVYYEVIYEVNREVHVAASRAVYYEVSRAVGFAVYDEIGFAVNDEIGFAVDDAVDDAVYDAIKETL